MSNDKENPDNVLKVSLKSTEGISDREPRVGWADKCKEMHENGDDALIWDDLMDINLIPEFRRLHKDHKKVTNRIIQRNFPKSAKKNVGPIQGKLKCSQYDDISLKCLILDF